MRRKLPLLILIVAWCAISCWYFSGRMSLPPGGRHAWAMSDYYAMALRFPERGFDIFHPQTFNLRTRDGITASDLPLPAWLSSLLYSATGWLPAFSFRFLTWLAGFAGLWFFYATLKNVLPDNPWRPVVLTLFVAVLPCGAFYSISFLPTPWAFAAFLGGLWAFSCVNLPPDQETNRRTRYFAWVVAGFTLAALLRKPFILYYLALLPWMWQQRGPRFRYWSIWLAGLAVFVSWQLYDEYLGRVYGSGFLRHLMPARDATEAWWLIREAFGKWATLWLTPAHWFWLVSAGMTALWALRESASTRSPLKGYFWPVFLAGGAYSLVMLKQFPDHDYYGIDAFYPALFLAVAALAHRTSRYRFWLEIEVVLLVIAAWSSAKKLDWYWDASLLQDHGRTNEVYRNTDTLLDSLGVSRDAKMLVFEAHSDNAPLIGMNRTGYCLNSSSQADVEAGLQRPWDYAACWDTFLVDDLINGNPVLLEKLERVGGSRGISVFRRNQAGKSTSLESLAGGAWMVFIDSTTTPAADGEYLMGKNISLPLFDEVVFYGKVGLNRPGALKATISLFKEGRNTGFADQSIDIPAGDTRLFRAVSVRVPPGEADEMRVYLWNPQRLQATFEAFRIAGRKK